MANDLAAGGVVHGPMTITQLFAGEAPIGTNHSVALADLDKYQVVVLTPTGLSETFDLVGDMDPALVLPTQGINCVITAQPALTGQNCPYYTSGHFNHAALVWPAALDTLAKRKAFFAGTPIQIGSIHNAAV